MSKLRVDEIETLDGLNTKDVASLIDDLSLTVDEVTATTYTPVLSDANTKLKSLVDASGVTLTIPANSSVAFGIGTLLSFQQGGAGQVTIEGAVGVTLDTTANVSLLSAEENSVFQAIKTGTDNWVVFGSLESTQVGFLLGSKQVFDTAGEFTWTKPAGVVAAMVEVVGSGAGGRGSAASASSGGGGAGGYAKSWVTSSLGSTETVTVGAGGAGGAAGGNNGIGGNPSSFGVHCSADGGIRGANVGGDGGDGTTGDVVSRGGAGQHRLSDGSTHVSGNGGDSFFGGGGLGVVSGSAAGQAGKVGGGGAGGRDNAAGGDGGDGIVIVWEYY